MIKATITLAFVSLLLAPIASSRRPRTGQIQVFPYSQQYGDTHAGAGARIDVHETGAGHRKHVAPPTGQAVVRVRTSPPPKAIGGATDAPLPPPVYPPLSASSPLLKKTQPAGPGSFWYQDGAGHVCEYLAGSSPICFTISSTGTIAPAVPALTPTILAEHAADRLTLSPGQIRTSPSGVGLTGAASWFWLDPAPAAERLSVTLAGEAVTVTAVPKVSWQFGDGVSLAAGAGIPYRPGAQPVGAVTHVYETRCLPGDKGHDPYVLESCAGGGYELVASVSWQISYRAAGPVANSGALPARTTTSSVLYPVSEARAFLVPNGSG